ncbi:TIGR03943 family protein [Anaerobacillus arseniciselenatis]|uniref:TIGR03943 family protein n=1 Tax=Anaerobacillus arseniciselenatis TaxID=85682 RepID=A0A1S2LT34_9BACI|nr:TIGR03943 family protein [Anaerobacillus arseniciselenatis]OIJ15678.1 TIGR03943 family protein [Anaerobacillus arseniciselenatis]
MNFSIQHAIKALLLLGFTAFLFKLHYSGEILKYVNPKFIIFTQIASIILLVMFFIQVKRVWENSDNIDCAYHEQHEKQFSFGQLFVYLLVSLPLITGLLLAPKELDANFAEKRGILFQSKGNEKESGDCGQGEEPPRTALQEELIEKMLAESPIVMSKENFSSYSDVLFQNPEIFKNKQIFLEGFILKGEQLKENEYVVGRFLITHCVADATVIGILSEFKDGVTFPDNSWVKLLGTVNVANHNDKKLPLIKVTHWKLTEKPEEPYVYPPQKKKSKAN